MYIRTMEPEKEIEHNFCLISDLIQQKKITKWVEPFKDELTAIYLNNQIHVISSICPHFGGEFNVDFSKSQLRCKWHDWRFDIESGLCKTYNIKTKLRHYKFEQINDTLLVKAL